MRRASVPRVRGLLRTYFPPLPRSVTTLQVGGLVNAFGNGITLPFLFIYLHNVRGIGLGIVGLIVGDARGRRASSRGRCSASSSTASAGGACSRSRSRSSPAATRSTRSSTWPGRGSSVAAITGVGVGGFWPSQSTLIAGLTTPRERPAAFAMQRVVMNLGIGLGALAGGLIATTESPGSFTVLFLLNALTFVVYGA